MLAIVEVGLIIRYAKAGPPETEAEAKAPIEPPERDAGRSDDRHDAFRGRRAGRAAAVVRLLRSRAMTLAEFWFVLVGFLFAGYFLLEGFDFGVGMLLPVLGRRTTSTAAS